MRVEICCPDRDTTVTSARDKDHAVELAQREALRKRSSVRLDLPGGEELWVEPPKAPLPPEPRPREPSDEEKAARALRTMGEVRRELDFQQLERLDALRSQRAGR